MRVVSQALLGQMEAIVQAILPAIQFLASLSRCLTRALGPSDYRDSVPAAISRTAARDLTAAICSDL